MTNISQNPSTPVRPGLLVRRPSDGVIEARSPEGQLLAHFNPTTNETRNHCGDFLGRGNRLSAVLRDLEHRSAAPGTRRR